MGAFRLSSRLDWVDADGRSIIAARALRGFAQSSVNVVVAIYLGLRGFSLVEIGLFLTLGSAGAAAAAIVIGLLADGWGRRRTLIVLSFVMAGTGTVLALADHFIVLSLAAFLGSFSALAGSGGAWGRSSRPSWPCPRRPRSERTYSRSMGSSA